MQIGEFADRTGVPQRLLRYYEERGLLTPGRTDAGHRTFQDSDVPRVETIRALLAAGLNTETIRIVLPCTDYRAGHLVPTCTEMLTHLAGEQDRQTASIARLERSKQAIDGLLAAAPPELTDPVRHAALHNMHEGSGADRV
ncbi:MerR family transcriptional regulator [Catenulispora sp. NF23]|uniref:MerR family transcriptional regulator n=1 Tax=Catenulispora pinistramenti TaxID=2705254 RepID=UPI001BAE07E8|nr:MerR family transcriptional regulator [Catenulispora pinistramenti]MBS2535255.1 MerR family transcriptional regulator [Catenulispora pinistramenti]